jgi:hypothetical protein
MTECVQLILAVSKNLHINISSEVSVVKSYRSLPPLPLLCFSLHSHRLALILQNKEIRFVFELLKQLWQDRIHHAVHIGITWMGRSKRCFSFKTS